MVIASGPDSLPELPAPAGFVVEWNDGTMTDHPSQDPSVRLLAHKERMSSPTMQNTIKKEQFLELLEGLGSHTFYYPKPLSEELTACGVSTTVAADGQGIIVEGQLVPVSTPEWGEPGISPSSVLSVVYELATGESPASTMTGRGFWYRDVMNQLAIFWGLDAKYL